LKHSIENIIDVDCSDEYELERLKYSKNTNPYLNNHIIYNDRYQNPNLEYVQNKVQN
jgi:hypothetical protein